MRIKRASIKRVADRSIQIEMEKLLSKLSKQLGATLGNREVYHQSHEYDWEPSYANAYADMVNDSDAVASIEYEDLDGESQVVVSLDGRIVGIKTDLDLEEMLFKYPLKILKQKGF